MLVLARKQKDKIYLDNAKTGERITLVQVEASHGKSRIGIEAGQDWRILRSELVDGMQPKEGAV